jgi:hypothetical protein
VHIVGERMMTQIVLVELTDDILSVLDETLRPCDRALRNTGFQYNIIRLVSVQAYHLTAIHQKVLQPVEGIGTYSVNVFSKHPPERSGQPCQMQLTYPEASKRRHDPGQEH